MGDQSPKCCSGFSEGRVPISWKKITQQRGGDSDINNCWGSVPGEGRAPRVGGSRLRGDPPSAEAEGPSEPPSPPGPGFVPPSSLRPAAGRTESQIHKNGGERGQEEHIFISLHRCWVDLDFFFISFFFFLG